MSNYECAVAAETALKAYIDAKGDKYEGTTVVTDFLGDLMHLCALENMDFGRMLDTARMHYNAERADALENSRRVRETAFEGVPLAEPHTFASIEDDGNEERAYLRNAKAALADDLSPMMRRQSQLDEDMPAFLKRGGK